MIGVTLLTTLSLAGSVSDITGPALASVECDPQIEPCIDIWASNDVVARGERTHAWFHATESSFLTVLRVDTDGRIDVLFPQAPSDDNFVSGSVLSTRAFDVHDYPGTGYLFAVSSKEPFDYSPFVVGHDWDFRDFAYHGRIVGDPYVALMDFIDSIVPPTEEQHYAYDVFAYHVGRTYDYPRFVCYDCHESASYTVWDPYAEACSRYQLVVFDAPQYYPARVYSSTRVVYSRPHRIEPRFVFRPRTEGDPPSVVLADSAHGAVRRSITAANAEGLGGTGSVAAPGVRRTLLDKLLEWGGPESRRDVVRVGEREPTQPSTMRDAVLRLRPRLQRRVTGGVRPSRVRKPDSTIPPASSPAAKPEN